MLRFHAVRRVVHVIPVERQLHHAWAGHGGHKGGEVGAVPDVQDRDLGLWLDGIKMVDDLLLMMIIISVTIES